MNTLLMNKDNSRRFGIALLICLVLIFCLQAVAIASDFSELTGYRSIIGADDSYISISGASIDYKIIDQYEAPATAVSPLDAYFAAKPVLLIIPGLLLLAFVIWFFYQGFKEVRQDQVLVGLTYWTLSFVLIGFGLLISMPLILGGANSIIWFK
jgi:hypothetical protein